MKINRLEAHDRLLYLLKDQSETVSQGASDCLKRNPLSLAIQARCPYIYIFGHARTHDNGVDKVLYWDPRMTKPVAQSNSYLFRAISNTDMLETCWILPPFELWHQFKQGNVVESRDVSWSIHQYKHNRKKLEQPFSDDLSDDKCKSIMLEIAREMEENIRMKKLYNLETSNV